MNKFMKKIMSKKDGFTLVELIVVIAILAILAGVAVPAYSGYIKKANEAADTTALAAVKTAAMAACATVGEVDRITVTAETNAAASKVEIYVGDTTTVDYTLTYDDANDKWTAAANNATDDEDSIAADFTAYMNKEDIELSYYDSADWYAADPTGDQVAGWNGVKNS